MSIHTLAQLCRPSRLPWWRWVELGGAVGLGVVAVHLLLGRPLHPLAIAALLHVAADFTFQSEETAIQKSTRDHHLTVHALAAGGFPLAVAALISGSPVNVLVWTIAGTASHYAVDWTRKFGVQRLALGVLLDQGCHLVTIGILGLVSLMW